MRTIWDLHENNNFLKICEVGCVLFAYHNCILFLFERYFRLVCPLSCWQRAYPPSSSDLRSLSYYSIPSQNTGYSGRTLSSRHSSTVTQPTKLTVSHPLLTKTHLSGCRLSHWAQPMFGMMSVLNCILRRKHIYDQRDHKKYCIINGSNIFCSFQLGDVGGKR